jgi:hypothetical protein
MVFDGGLTIHRTVCGPVRLASEGNGLEPGKQGSLPAWTPGLKTKIRNKTIPLLLAPHVTDSFSNFKPA